MLCSGGERVEFGLGLSLRCSQSSALSPHRQHHTQSHKHTLPHTMTPTQYHSYRDTLSTARQLTAATYGQPMPAHRHVTFCNLSRISGWSHIPSQMQLLSHTNNQPHVPSFPLTQTRAHTASPVTTGPASSCSYWTILHYTVAGMAWVTHSYSEPVKCAGSKTHLCYPVTSTSCGAV